jgi:crotonobetainyl-CoA:carnitine CoA-transferase CaiB-like acyl-CoA transferase
MLESDRYWADLVTKVGRPELADDPRFADSVARSTNSEACVAVLDEIFAARTFDEWKAVLSDVKGVWAPVQSAGELLEDPQALANGYVRQVRTDTGATFQSVTAPLQFDEQPSDLGRAPHHGEHTDEVLAELGLDVDTILELKVAGAVL